MIPSSLVRGLGSLTVAASLFVIAQPTSADQITTHISQDQRQLARVKAEIAALRAQIAAAQNQEATLTVLITGLDRQIAATEAQVVLAKARLSAINAQLSAAQVELDAARTTLGNEEHQLGRELVVYYEFENQSTPLSNLLFMASLALTLVSFLSTHKMSIWCSAAISGALFLARVFSDRMAAKQQLALRPVTVPRLHC